MSKICRLIFMLMTMTSSLAFAVPFTDINLVKNPEIEPWWFENAYGSTHMIIPMSESVLDQLQQLDVNLRYTCEAKLGYELDGYQIFALQNCRVR